MHRARDCWGSLLDQTTAYSLLTPRNVPRSPPAHASRRSRRRQVMPHEVVTLQLGTYANYVGAHFWNIQVGSSPFVPSEPEPDAVRCSGQSGQDELHAASDEATRNSINWDVLYREGVDDKVRVCVAVLHPSAVRCADGNRIAEPVDHPAAPGCGGLQK
jgi:hypothetical protein